MRLMLSDAQWELLEPLVEQSRPRAAGAKPELSERLFAKLKQFRRAATRYEKLKETFLGVVHLALGFIRLRKLAFVNTT